MIAPQTEYHGSSPETLIIFDARLPGASERLHRERSAYREDAHLEAMAYHFVLIVRASGALFGRGEHGK